MSLSESIRGAVDAAFNAVGDLKKAVTITTVGSGTYDPITDSTTGATTQSVTLYGIIGNYTAYEIASSYGSILFSDIKLICNNSDISITVNTTSVFSIDSVAYKIVNPANTGRSASGINSKAGDFVKVFQLRAF